MYFLIDHENIGNNGYKGTEFLLPEDTVEIFYSNSSGNIMFGLFKDMEQAGCNIKICKLYQTRKNALDFYITSKVGELVGSGFSGNVVIVSGDNGFKSVQEYWTKVTTNRKPIRLAPTIADAIACAGEENSRTRILQERLKTVSIESEYLKYEERVKIHNLLLEKFRDTRFLDKVDEIEKMYEKKSSKKILYLNTVKRFGKRDGLLVYQCLKELVG